MSSTRSCFVLSFCALLVAAGCRSKEPDAPAVATPSVSFAHTRVPLGSPVEVTYKFQVVPNAPAFQENYRVMVHFLDADEELMWADDHDPPVPSTQWKPGQTIEYTRMMFIPIYPYVGKASVHVGLYSPKTQKRLTLTGQTVGQHEYTLASLQLLPHSENVFLLFKDGWHPQETAQGNSAVEWQWTKKTATLSFRNPKKPSVFYLHADGAYIEPQTLAVKVNGQQVDTITVTPKQEFIHKTPLTVQQLGPGDMVELTLEVDKTWVPALLPNGNSKDSRELGIRVFHAFVEPQS
ncbi:MAG TPA: hypothetical protein VJ260_06515 [Vicinamibacterales bacterium]|jgi:hypothetical protein|nr:hypothetical protein [Vicinamibacterales bacterium]